MRSACKFPSTGAGAQSPVASIQGHLGAVAVLDDGVTWNRGEMTIIAIGIYSVLTIFQAS